jgi:hypothetical protein
MILQSFLFVFMVADGIRCRKRAANVIRLCKDTFFNLKITKTTLASFMSESSRRVNKQRCELCELFAISPRLNREGGRGLAAG